jgi:DNA-binding XRE family transcriptional regulator
LQKSDKVNIIIYNNGKGVVNISTENPLKVQRERLLISRSELARKASLSVMTLQRIEKGKPCRLDTKRKIVKALGFNPWRNNEKVSFPER